MNNLINLKNLINLIIVLLFIACSSSRHISKGNKAPSQAEIRLKDVNTDMLIDAKKDEILGNYDNAIDEFKKLIAKNTGNDAAKYELANVYIIKGNTSAAIPLLKDAIKIDPDNEWYILQLAKTYEQTQQFDNAALTYEKIVKEFPDDYDQYYNLANQYIIKGKFNDAIRVYNELESKIGVNEELSVQKKTLYLDMNKIDKAVAEIQKLIDKYPKEVKYYFLKAEIYTANNKDLNKAFDIYNKILSLDPDNPAVHLRLAEYYREKGDKEKSYDELKTAFANPKLNLDLELQTMVSYFNVTDTYPQLKDQAYALSDILIKTHPDKPVVYEVYGDFLIRDKKYLEAHEKYDKAIELDSSKYEVWEQVLRIDAQLKDFKKLISESSKAIELFPLQPEPYLLNGDANLILKKYNDAIKSLKKGVSVTVDNNELLVDFYSNLGDSYNEVKNYSASDSAYDKALSINPDYELVLNNYAYFLCLRGEKMQKAEDMANKAVTLAPDSPSCLDTYGWILYKSGKLDKAREMVEKALDKGGSNEDIILEHYGDILYKSGYTEKALIYWKKAKQAGKGTELLDKKIADGKLYE